MSRKEVVVSNVSKEHDNPIAELVQVACRYDSEIILESNNRRINAKSIMGLMTLGLRAGESVTVHADGSDEEDAVDKIEAYLTGRSVINARAEMKDDSYKIKRKPCEHRCPHGFLIHNQQYLSGV